MTRSIKVAYKIGLLRVIIFSTLAIFSQIAYAIIPVTVVYRADERSISEVITTGMRPWDDGGIPDDDLAHHFDGESVEGHTDRFVSTSMTLRSVVDHAASLARPNSEEPFDEDYLTYIYEIRPAANFYAVDDSFSEAMLQSAPDTQRHTRLQAILRDYGGMEEMVALDGFAADRIIRYVAVTGEMLNQYYPSGQMYSPLFWESRWMTEGVIYDHTYDGDTSSTAVWTVIDTPRGYTDLVMNGTQSEVPLAATCMSVNPSSDMLKRQPNRGASDSACPSFVYLNLKRQFYDKKLLAVAAED